MSENCKKFRKQERLCKETAISELFRDSNSFFIYPFRVVWRESLEERKYPVQIAISVGKKRIKRAVNRNLLKRRIREAYRLNKEDLYKALENNKIDVMLIYMISEIKDYSEIEKSVIRIIEKFKTIEYS